MNREQVPGPSPSDDNRSRDADQAEAATSLVAEVRRILRSTDFQRPGYRTVSDLLWEKHGLDPEDIRRDLRRGRVSGAVVRAIAGDILDREDGAALLTLKGKTEHRRFVEKPTTSVDSIIERRRDGGFFRRHAPRLLELYGGITELKSEGEALLILKRAVLAPRMEGDYRAALINGLILTRWLLDERPRGLDHPGICNAFLVGVGRAIGQAEKLGAHKFIMSLAREFAEANSESLLARRSYLDMFAQYNETAHRRDDAIMRKVLRHYDEEAEIARSLILQRVGVVLGYDQLYSILEAHLNRLTAMVNTRGEPRAIEASFKEMNELATAVDTVARTSALGYSEADNINLEAPLFHRMLYGRYLLMHDRPEEALEIAEGVIETIGHLAIDYPFLVGKANLLAGRVKMRCRTLSRTSTFDAEIDAHRVLAISAFQKVGNIREGNAAIRDLRLPLSKGSA